MHIVQKSAPQARDYIRQKLIAYNTAQLPPGLQEPKEEISFHLENDAGEVIGGVAVTMYWEHLHIDFFWVDERCRHAGHGSRLLREVERFAREKGCRLIVLDTLSFQAPAFYQKHGYQVFGVLEDHPRGFSQAFLHKRLG